MSSRRVEESNAYVNVNVDFNFNDNSLTTVIRQAEGAGKTRGGAG